jgi:hypothetical protein
VTVTKSFDIRGSMAEAVTTYEVEKQYLAGASGHGGGQVRPSGRPRW